MIPERLFNLAKYLTKAEFHSLVEDYIKDSKLASYPKPHPTNKQLALEKRENNNENVNLN
jgi:hypothetical protein